MVWNDGDFATPANMNSKVHGPNTVGVTGDNSTRASRASAVQDAIDTATANGHDFVYVPESFTNYDASSVTFDNAVRMVREGQIVEGFDVQAYGATTDGITTNDVAAISAANSAAETNGGRVVFPPGSYSFGGDPGITVSSRVEWVGIAGANARWRGGIGTNAVELIYTGSGTGIRIASSTSGHLDGIAFKNLLYRSNGGAPIGVHLDQTGSSATSIIGTLFHNVAFGDTNGNIFTTAAVQRDGTVFDTRAVECSFINNQRGVKDVGSGHSQFTARNCFGTSRDDTSAWVYELSGGQCRILGGTVSSDDAQAGGNRGNGVWAKSALTMVGVNVEGVDVSGSVGVRYRGNSGLEVLGGSVHRWGFNVEVGGQGWAIAADIENSVDADLHVESGGTRTGVVRNHAASQGNDAFTFQDDRKNTDGVNGEWHIQADETDDIITAPNTGDAFQYRGAQDGNEGWRFVGDIGFYSNEPVAQQTAPASLTDNSGGTTDDTVEAVSGSGADSAINNNFAELTEELNQIRTALINLGLWS